MIFSLLREHTMRHSFLFFFGTVAPRFGCLTNLPISTLLPNSGDWPFCAMKIKLWIFKNVSIKTQTNLDALFGDSTASAAVAVVA